MEASSFSHEAGSMHQERDIAWAANTGSGDRSVGAYRTEVRDHQPELLQARRTAACPVVALSQRTIK